MGSLIDGGDYKTWQTPSDWNTYRKIIDLQIGNRGRDSETMSSLLDNNESILKDEMGEAEYSH
jgi:hypothetical protein